MISPILPVNVILLTAFTPSELFTCISEVHLVKLGLSTHVIPTEIEKIPISLLGLICVNLKRLYLFNIWVYLVDVGVKNDIN